MPTNLLDPGCGGCQDCCQFCDDHYDPNEWYTLFCDVPKFAGDSGGTFFGQYIWGAHSIDSVINGTLVNYNFDPLTQPYESNPGATKSYRVRIPFGDLDQSFTLTVQETGFNSSTILREYDVEFTIANCEIEVQAFNVCHPNYSDPASRRMRQIAVSIWADISCDVGTVSGWDKYVTAMWRGNSGEKACTDLVTSSGGLSPSIAHTMPGEDTRYYRSPIRIPTFSVAEFPAGRAVTKVNDPLLSCGGYGG